MLTIDKYFKLFNIPPCMCLDDLYRVLLNKADSNYAEKVVNSIIDRADGKETDLSKNFYDIKNSSFEGSIALAIAYGLDFYKKAFAYVISNSERLGDKVLIVGCDVGVDACFFAMMFPEKEFLGIDLCESAIKNAIKLAEKMDISNIKFKACGLDQVNSLFDSIISLRTVHENFIDDFTCANDYLPYIKRADYFSKGFNYYSNNVSKHLKTEGHFIGIERIDEFECLSLCLSSQRETLRFLQINNIDAIELGEESCFTGIVLKKDNSHFDNKKVYETYFEKAHPFSISNTQTGYCAEYYLEKYAYKLESGFCLRDKTSNGIIVQIGFFRFENGIFDDVIMVYIADNNKNLYFIDECELASQIEKSKSDLKQYVSSTIIIEDYCFDQLCLFPNQQ